MTTASYQAPWVVRSVFRGREASEKLDRREIVKKIAKSCRPLISEDQFRNRGADIMLMKSSSVAKSRIGTFSKCQLNARIRRRRPGSQERRGRGGVCESQRRA